SPGAGSTTSRGRSAGATPSFAHCSAAPPKSSRTATGTPRPSRTFAPQVRTVILHGRNDTVVEVQQAISYEAAARRARRLVVMRLFDDASHGSWANLAGPQWGAAKVALLGL